MRITLPFLFIVALLVYSCGPLGYTERVEYQVLASVENFSIPDSSRSNDIRVKMSGVLGGTTAFSLKEILYQRQDTLYSFAVFALLVEESGKKYEERVIRYDTTLVLTLDPPRTKMHYFTITGSNGVFNDSSFVY